MEYSARDAASIKVDLHYDGSFDVALHDVTLDNLMSLPLIILSTIQNAASFAERHISSNWKRRVSTLLEENPELKQSLSKARQDSDKPAPTVRL